MSVLESVVDELIADDNVRHAVENAVKSVVKDELEKVMSGIDSHSNPLVRAVVGHIVQHGK